MSPPGAETKLRIRMYNVGFGDCFLITIPGATKRSILVDAGFHSQGKGAFSNPELVDQVLKDVEAWAGKKRVDVIVATHRHQDHITSFNVAAWDDLEIGEVWMPWVDDPDNPAAVKMWKKKDAFAAMLAAALPGFPLQPKDKAAAEFVIWNAGIGPAPAGFEAYSNAAALDRLREGFPLRDRNAPRYLPASSTFPEEFETDLLPGVRVHVLGPPRDPDLIAELDPESDGETYRALALRASEAGGEQMPELFADAWNVDPADPAPEPLTQNEQKRLNDLARGFDPLFAAAKLDGMINSTSLVLVLQIGKARLLLPGDAEWGTWKVILADKKARALLKGTTFLKVGHHGSHNATPKTLVEEILPAGVCAMVSTQTGDESFRNNIPLEDLLTALRGAGCDLVRSDANGTTSSSYERDNGDRWIDLHLPF